MHSDFMPNVNKRIMPHLLSNPDYEPLRADLSEEISEDYQFSMRKSIGKIGCVHACICRKFVPFSFMQIFDLCSGLCTEGSSRTIQVKNQFNTTTISSKVSHYFITCLPLYVLLYRTIRAPVPWHDSFAKAWEMQNAQLFITNTVMKELRNLWDTKWVGHFQTGCYTHTYITHLAFKVSWTTCITRFMDYSLA